MKRRTVLLVAIAMPSTALAQSANNYQCTMGGMARRVEVASDGEQAVPCEVVYFKDTEAPGERQVLWNAVNEAGYCEAQAETFVARLESLGWQCDVVEERAPAPAQAEADAAEPD